MGMKEFHSKLKEIDEIPKNMENEKRLNEKILKNLEKLAEFAFNNKILVRKPDFRSDYEDIGISGDAVFQGLSRALEEQQKYLSIQGNKFKSEFFSRELEVKRNSIRDLERSLKLLSVFGKNKILEYILDICITKGILVKNNFSDFITLTFEDQYKVIKKDDNGKIIYNPRLYITSRVKGFNKYLESEKINYIGIYEFGVLKDNVHVHYLINKPENCNLWKLKTAWKYGRVFLAEKHDKYRDFVYMIKEYHENILREIKKEYPIRDFIYYNVKNKLLSGKELRRKKVREGFLQDMRETTVKKKKVSIVKKNLLKSKKNLNR